MTENSVDMIRLFLTLTIFLSVAISDVAGATNCLTTVKAAIHGVYRDSAGKIIRREPISHSSVVIDSNLLVDLRVRELGGGPTDALRVVRANNLRKKIKDVEKHDEKFHYYIAERTAKEVSELGNRFPIYFPEGTRIFSTSVRRESDVYKKMVGFLEDLKVGKLKEGSFKDREIIADLFFAERTHIKDVPTFATADRGIFNPLCALLPDCKKLGGDPAKIAEKFPKGFEVAVRDADGVDRVIRILPFL